MSLRTRGIRAHRYIGFHAAWRKPLPLNLGRVTYLTLGIVSIEWSEPSPDDGATAINTWRREAAS